jgi:stage II sporulation protein AA (anti-sigma F factor antagonist)
MDSSGIGMIMGRYKNLVPGGYLKIFGVNQNIKKIFDLSGLNKIIKFYETKEQALATEDKAIGDKHD